LQFVESGWNGFFSLDSLGLISHDTQQARPQAIADHRDRRAAQPGLPGAMFECSTVEALAEYVRGLQGSVVDQAKAERLSDLMAELEGL